MVLIALLCCVLAWLSHPAKIQRDAVMAIKRSGGIVVYDWDVGEGVGTGGLTLSPAKWVVEWLGPDYFTHVRVVNLRGTATDDDLAAVARLSRLECLKISYSPITDTGLQNLNGLVYLKRLDLHETSITDAALVHLRGMTRLETLYVVNTKLTDAGLLHLAEMRSLKQIYLPVGISYRGVEALSSALPNALINRGYAREEHSGREIIP